MSDLMYLISKSLQKKWILALFSQKPAQGLQMIKGNIHTTPAVKAARNAAQTAEQGRIDQEWSDMMASMRENGLDPDYANTIASHMKKNAENRAQLKAPVVAVMMTPAEFERIRAEIGL